MKLKPKQFVRLLHIHALLVKGYCPTCRVLKERFGVAMRTIYRDFAVLRHQLKAPLKYDVSRRGYYYTIPGWNIW